MGDMSREPSMEDILSSIRRVIARDETPGTVHAPQPVADDVLDLHDEELGDAATPSADEDLVSATSADAARQSLETLTAAVAPAVASAATAAGVAPPSGRTMEDVVIEALRPMLKQWLDANLPSLVEAMVAKEIGRITGKRL